MKQRAFHAGIKSEGEEIELSFASEEPYMGEILRMHGADLSRLEGGAVLLNHDRSRLIGVIKKAWTEGDKARASISLLASNPDAEMIRGALAAGWRGDASVGYDYDGDDTRSTRDGYEVTRWRALEISLVTVPADSSVGIGRSLVDTGIKVMEKTDPEIQKQAAASLEEIENTASRSIFSAIPQSERITAIKELYASGANLREVGQRFLQIAETKQSAPITNTSPVASPRDIGKYSLSRAALIAAGKVRADGIEGEIHSELTQRFAGQRSPQGVCVPRELITGQRTNLATQNSTGGYLTQIDNRNDLLIPYLYPNSIVARLGVRNLTGLVNSFTIPRGTAGATAEWVGEGASPSKTTPALGQISSTPKGLAAYVERTMQLLQQGGSGVDSWLRNELQEAARVKIDGAFWTGGGGASPEGLVMQSGLGSVTFGGAVVWADVMDYIKAIENADQIVGDQAKWLCNPTVAAKWQSVEQATGTAQWIMERTPESVCAGYGTVKSTTLLTSGTYANRMAFGNWDSVLFCEYFSPEIRVTEDATLARSGKVQISLLQHVDILFTRPSAIVLSTDSAAQ